MFSPAVASDEVAGTRGYAGLARDAGICWQTPAMNPEPTPWDALGAFLLSPGFGGLAALVAAWLALRGVRLRLTGDRELADKARLASEQAQLDADTRERWWQLARWADAQIDAGLTPESALLGLLAEMQGSVATREQSAMLECLAVKLVEASDREEVHRDR